MVDFFRSVHNKHPRRQQRAEQFPLVRRQSNEGSEGKGTVCEDMADPIDNKDEDDKATKEKSEKGDSADETPMKADETKLEMNEKVDTAEDKSERGTKRRRDEDDKEAVDDNGNGGDVKAADGTGAESNKTAKKRLRPNDDNSTVQKVDIPSTKLPRRKRKSKLLSDAITFFIPIDVTADLRIAIQRTKAKRIKSIYQRFPSLRKEGVVDGVAKKEDQDGKLDDDETNGGKDRDPKSQAKKKKKLAHVPQPHQYGSVLDYLEAKYVRGVMVGDEDEDGDGGGSIADRSEGHGSVYSGGSFLDDTDLQRDVAEQVMANTTMTKLELEEDDADFFVNVGNLEVEDNEYGDHYDPLQDKEKTQGPNKKRKKSQNASLAGTASSTGTGGASAAASGKKKKKQLSPAPTPDTAKSKKPMSPLSTGTAKTKKPMPTKAQSSAEIKKKTKIAKKAKTQVDGILKKISAMIKGMNEEELPKRRTKLKVALTCPANKKPGDDITFTNPHNPGQRLRVKVPKDSFPGGTFRVTVPVKQPPPDSDSDGTDHNKFSRNFQELLDDYARAYDEWCSRQAEVDKKFAVFKEKQYKFERLAKEFPQNLLTPVDANYLKKIVRRARQNKHKRIKTAAAKQQSEGGGGGGGGGAATGAAGGKTGKSLKDDGGTDHDDDGGEEDTKPPDQTINIPSKGSNFPVTAWNEDDFIFSQLDMP